MRRVPGYSLWLGHAGDARDVRRLLDAGIAAVIDLAIQEAPAPVARELAYGRFPLVDGSGNPPWLLRSAVETVAGLLRDEVPTLVGCGAGLSRSPCIAGAAIARIAGCPPEEGLAIALHAAPADVSPALWAEVRAAFPWRRPGGQGSAQIIQSHIPPSREDMSRPLLVSRGPQARWITGRTIRTVPMP